MMMYIIMALIATLLLWKTIRFVLQEEKTRKNRVSTSGVVIHIHRTRYQSRLATGRVYTR